MNRTVKIGWRTYKIIKGTPREVSEGMLCGEIDYLNNTIFVNDALEGDLYNVTVLHEIIHGILHNAGREQDEGLVECLSEGLYQVWKENKCE